MNQGIFHKVEIYTLKIMALTLYMHNREKKMLEGSLGTLLIANLIILPQFFFFFFWGKFNFQNYIFNI